MHFLVYPIKYCFFYETFSKCKVGDCEFQSYQTVSNLKWTISSEFTTNSAIIYIYYNQLGFIIFHSFLTNYTQNLHPEEVKNILLVGKMV